MTRTPIMLRPRLVPTLALGLSLLLAACSDDGPSADCVPGAVEQCGGGDEDCDGLTDEPGANGCRAFRQDNDGDGQPDGDERCLCAATPPWTFDSGATPCGVCDDGNPCTDDVCATASTTCQHTAREGSCEDIDPCTVDTFCRDGVCQGGGELACDDGNPCTGDLCHAGVGCAFVALFTACDDNDRCTERDQCSDGRCVGTPLANCGEPYCGDGECTDDESCADCEADCSPLGFGHCGAACDPLGASCGADAVCIPGDLGGVCLSELTPCDATDGSGCPTGEACAFVAGPDFGGSAALCQPIVEALHAGDACRRDLAPCAEGAICWRGTCTTTCDPGAPHCALGGACEAVGDAFGRDAPDLGVCRPACGDARCEGGENCQSCPGDCGACTIECGDGRCVVDGESCDSCPDDCGPCPGCGDGGCAFGMEDCANCAADCGACTCGDGACSTGEDCRTCRVDCGDCVCGDGQCDATESCSTCRSDCGDCACGDGVCDMGEDCGTCAQDCGPCPCGDGRCDPGEDCATCRADCLICVCGDGRCIASENADNCPNDCAGSCGDGTCAPTESCETCAADCGACTCGDGHCSPDENCDTCRADCGACTCGDDHCSALEGCEGCPADCGACACGDGVCQAGEDCASCMADCGACECGDGVCSATESCFACAKDCGECPQWCGDGVCSHPDETCYGCPNDCPICTDICGDGICGASESCLGCAADCDSFMGVGGCGGTCDFLQQDCPASYLCMPVADGALNAKVYDVGDGVCGATCSRDADCGAGACVAIDGADTPRVCVATVQACDPVDGAGCDAESYCMARTGNAAQGVCVVGCRRDDATACGAHPDQCHRGTGHWWRPGICVGQPTSCSPAAQTGCGPDETCALLGPPPGQAPIAVCTTRVGTVSLGGACGPGDDDLCAAGLLCASDVCRRPCKPGNTAGCQPGEMCVDVGTDRELGLAPGVLGVCR